MNGMELDVATAQEDAVAALLLPSIRRALQLRSIDTATRDFLRLPSLETRRERYLEETLRDAYAAGLLEATTVLSFLENLPQWHWTLDGCCVLHRVHATLEASSVQTVHVPALPLAYFLHKLMNHLDGSVKIRAESYWYEWVSPTIRAVAAGKPVVIESSMRRETLYAPANNFAFDFDRRNVFTWRLPWTPDERKEQWRLVPASVSRDKFYLQSVQFGEYLYAADYAKFRRDERGNLRSRVFGWRKRNEPVGESGHWQLAPIDPNDRDVFAIYNPYQKEYLYSPSDVYDRDRRYVFTATHSPRDASWLEERKWRIVPVDTSPMEQGIEAFYMKKYPVAIDLLTTALDDLSDHTEHVKCFVYRMAANLRMGHTHLLQADFDKIDELGGDKAAIFHGLHHLWCEIAAVLQLQQQQQANSNSSSSSSVTIPVSVECQLLRGDQLFIAREYEAALASYDLAARTGLDTTDRSLVHRQFRAKLACAKCKFALQNPDGALAELEEILASGSETTHKMEVELEARILMWIGRCKRQLHDYEQAMKYQEEALDKIAPCPDNSNQWLRYCIVIEMQVVGLFRKELLNTLLASSEVASAHLPSHLQTETGARSAERIATQMVELFHCPLSLEPMEDPVMTPNGDTYEREMIEHHLDVNGQFDPLTRAPLTKAQLYPNRVLKMLMETLLSEHKLGVLLASYNL